MGAGNTINSPYLLSGPEYPTKEEGANFHSIRTSKDVSLCARMTTAVIPAGSTTTQTTKS